jgi:wobble nucleotide-excising tRNase
MIRNIKILGLKSFPRNAPLNITINNKRVVMFYGLNGSGKTTIGQVIDRNGNDREPYVGCEVATTGHGQYRYLVYNDEFVDRNFRGKAEFPGIFSIGEKDAEALKEEEETQKRYEEIAGLKEALLKRKTVRSGDARTALSAAHDATWAVYQTHGDGPLKGCTEGFGKSKQKLFDKLLGIQSPGAGEISTVEDLVARVRDLDGANQSEKQKLTLGTAGFRAVENDEIWNTPVLGSSDSGLSSLIHELGNIDWVGQGRKFLLGNQCPFCQQTLQISFKNELSVLIDGVYSKRVSAIGGLVMTYHEAIDASDKAVKTLLASEPFAKEHATFAKCWAELHQTLTANLAEMRFKVDHPGKSVTVSATTDYVQALGIALSEINNRIDVYNERIRNRTTEKLKLQTDFWKQMRHQYNPSINIFEEIQADVRNDIKTIDDALEQHADRARELQQRLSELRKKNVSTDQAVEVINKRLRSIGITSFQIKKKEGEGNLYCLERPPEGVDEYRSLSEGEKTLISFFYFLAHVNGAIDVDNPVVHDRKIVVIDDPISSLSHNYVYDIASIIVNEIICGHEGGKQVKQAIMLTHSLFFYHELLKQLDAAKEKSCEFFRVVKNETSAVFPMEKGAIKNEYTGFWQVLKDAQAGSGNPVSVPNAMRCIFEYFFGFTQQEAEFKRALRSLEEGDHRFAPLARFLDRKSHSDPINLFDHGGYDVAYYLAKFKAVFEQTDYKDHYSTMMGEEMPA